MNVLLISSQHHPMHGGIGAYVSRFVEAARQAEWRIELITRPSDVLPPASEVHLVGTIDQEPDFARRLTRLRQLHAIRPYRYALWSAAVAKRLLELDGPYDAIEFVDCQAEGFGSLLSQRVRRRFAGVPMIIHAHTPMFLEEEINRSDTMLFGRQTYHRWERQALKHADGIVVTSSLMKVRLQLASPTTVIPYPIQATPLLQPCQDRSKETIVVVGSVQPRKGVQGWARSLNQVLRERPQANALLVGPDTVGDDGMSMARRVGEIVEPALRKRFHYLGPLKHEAVLSLLAQASLVVVPSIFESFSFVAAEAICLGTPVAVSDQVGIGEHVPDLPRFAAEDVSAMAEAQIRMLERVKCSQDNARVCRAQLLQNCAPQRHLELREQFIHSLPAQTAIGSIAADDSLDELESFIASVEEAERDERCCSMAVS